MAEAVDGVVRVMVLFDGEGAGEGALSWGQAEYWEAVGRLGHWHPLGGIKPLEPGTTVEDVAEELRYLMSRYPVARTRLRFDAAGRPAQHVAANGTIALEVVEAGDTDPEKVADLLADRYRMTELDFAAEWPVRMGVVRQGPRPTHLVTVMSHLTVDGTGGGIMLREVAARTADPVPEMQPLAQTRWQQAPAGQRQNAAALHHCEGVFRAIAPDQFAGHGEDRQPRYWQGELRSAALPAALRTIAEHTGAESSTILLALFATAVRGRTGVNPVLVRPIIANRFRLGLAAVVCTLAQAGYCALEVDHASFRETLRRAKRAVLGASKHAYADPRSIAELRDRIAAERGVTLETACYLNDRRKPRREAADQPSGETAGGPTAPPGDFRWIRSQDGPALEKLLLEIDDAPEGVRVTLTLDTAYISLAEGKALIQALEDIAVAQAGAATADPFPTIVEILTAATGADAGWAASVTPESRLEEDLHLESMEMLALGDALRDRYGVDLPALLTRLGIDELIALSVGDLVALCRG
jgi:acyl carrier protein